MKVLAVLLVVSLVVVYGGRDFYSILNVSRTASKSEIKKSYRLLASQVHPDKNPNDPEAESKIRDLNDAYEVLSKDEKRQIYDRYGEEGLKKHADSDFASPFSFTQGSHETPRGGDVVMDLWVTLEELYIGAFIELTRLKLVKTPARGTRKCNCRTELKATMLGPGRFQMTQEQVCNECPNVDFVPEEQTLDIEIKPGMPDGHIFPFNGEGEPHTDGEAGDLRVRIRQQNHKTFHRRGNDLHTNITLTLVEALNGYSLQFTHLDGHQVVLQSDKITAPGTVIRKPNEGMPRFGQSKVRGSLYITVDVQFPQNQLTDEQRKLVKQMFSAEFSKLSTDVSGNPSIASVYNGLDGIKISS